MLTNHPDTLVSDASLLSSNFSRHQIRIK